MIFVVVNNSKGINRILILELIWLLYICIGFGIVDDDINDVEV